MDILFEKNFNKIIIKLLNSNLSTNNQNNFLLSPFSTMNNAFQVFSKNFNNIITSLEDEIIFQRGFCHSEVYAMKCDGVVLNRDKTLEFYEIEDGDVIIMNNLESYFIHFKSFILNKLRK